MKLESGTRVGDWCLLERLGGGAFGEVWKARHAHLPRTAAIKFATAERAVAALRAGGVAQFGLDHPGIVQVLDASLSSEPPYVVLEHVDGPTLRQLLRERGRLEIPDASGIFRQLVDAVAFAHARGVVHGDVKPENILVARGVSGDVPTPRVKLTDFQMGAVEAGVRPADGGLGGLRPSLVTRGPIGTYHYLAPEQEDNLPIDGRADIYALGVVLFEMLTGSLPQGRDLPSDLEPSISWWWDHIFSRCYTGRERRYVDARALQDDIAAAARGPAWGEMPSQKGHHDEAPSRGGPPRVASRTPPGRVAVEPTVRLVSRPARRPLPRSPVNRPGRIASVFGLVAIGIIGTFGGLALSLRHDLARRGRLAQAQGLQRVLPSQIAFPVGGSLEALAGTYLRAYAILERTRGPDEVRAMADEIREIRRQAGSRGLRLQDGIRDGERTVTIYRSSGFSTAPLGEYALTAGSIGARADY